MKYGYLLQVTNPALEIIPAGKQFTPLGGRPQPRPHLPVLRRSAVVQRTMFAALREAELAVWQATGGDFLHVVKNVRQHNP